MVRGVCLVAVTALVAACTGPGDTVPTAASGGALETPHPLAIHVTTDATRAASAVIGPGGGTVSVTTAAGATLALSIPAGALLSPHSVTLTPIASASGMPLKGGVLAGAQLGPDGLVLARPATLTVKLSSAPGGGMQAYGFGYRHGGTELHLMKTAGGGTSLSLALWHFSGAGVAAGSSGDASGMAANAPTAPEDQVEQAQALGRPFVQLLEAWDAMLTAQIGQSPPNLALLDLAYQQALVFGADATQAGRPDLARGIFDKIGLALKVAAQLAVSRCRGEPNAIEGLRVIRWIEWAHGHPEVLQQLDAPSLEADVVKCLRFKLDFTTIEHFSFPPEAIDLTVEAKDIAIDAVTAVPLKFLPGVGDLKYDSYVWTVPGVPYTMSFSIDRPFTVEDVSMDLDLIDLADPAVVVDGMTLTVDFGDTTETATVEIPQYQLKLPFKSYYASGMRNMHQDTMVGPNLFEIRGWSLAAEPVFATLHETCPCAQVPGMGAAFAETQDTTWKLQHEPQ